MKPVIPRIPQHISSRRQRLYRFAAVSLWLAVWETAAIIIDREIFLPGPILVLSSFFRLAGTADFWRCVSFSVFNIAAGYTLAVIVGLFLAWLSYIFPLLKELFALPLKIIRTVPVASFIILALLWISSKRLSMLISFLMVLPIVYENILCGLNSTDPSLLEMAAVVRMPFQKRLRMIYRPVLMPHLYSALSTGAGLAWKSGIASEVIGITRNSIGNRLYQSKIYLETPELFAWTLTIIIISLFFESLIKLAVKKGGSL